MEYLVLFFASALAGIGTGLAGLSAATVMVPILIVFCPSFQGSTGVYQATTVALFSDILASAFTSFIYIRNKNIDLKRGSIMLVCILIMSTLGSYVAFIVGNIVLGSFSLFLTFFIGIRFLVKPETGNPEASETKFSGFILKEILVSLFFGLTIGFGTGFVGTGGGMMMLVVFTVFLKMGQRTAVGTSTFIMTFTALLAGISHIIIEPEILFEKWEILLFCLAVTAIASIVSAQFANKVNEWTVGVVTGVILTILGFCMLILFYWDYLSQFSLIINSILSLEKYLILLIGYIAFILIANWIFKFPKPIFRKLLHLVAMITPIALILFSNSWIATDLILVFFGVVAYLLLLLFEDLKGYSKFFNEKREGEIRRSLIEFISTALLIVTVSGMLEADYIAIASYLMWGLGDAFAGIIGKYFGKKKLTFKGADSNKTVLGSFSMLIVSFVAGLTVLVYFTSYNLLINIITVLIAALFGTYTEAICKNGMDTVYTPIIISAVLVICDLIFQII